MSTLSPLPYGGDESRCPVIGIVGGGLAGTLTAVQLLRRASRPLDVVLLDRSGQFGPGVAYATRSEQHLLNQPAERMSAFADAPGHFREWASSHVGLAEPGAFLPRRLYGDYLRSLLDEAVRRRAPGVALHRASGEVVELRRIAGGASLRLADGRAIACDRVVLALGPLPARRLPSLPIDPRVVADPWAPGALEPPPPAATVLLIGTGLTAVDATLSLCDSAPDVRVVAVSRRGMLPFAHLSGVRAVAPAPSLLPHPTDVGGLDRMYREHVARMQAVGFDWRDVVDGLRPLVPRLWRSLPVTERRRFLRTHARVWEVRRHRMAPQLAERVRDLRASGRLVVLAGEVTGARATAAGIDVAIGARTVTAARVIACTGLAEDITRVRDPLIRTLLAHGHVAPDPLGLGLRTSPSGAVLDRHGHPSDSLFALGALRRGELWESTAAAEIRAQAADVASSSPPSRRVPARRSV